MDARALKDKATELFSKGKFAKAAEAYETFCKADQKDMQARLRMGDAWAKSGNQPKAIAAYQSAAEGFAKEGFLPRAIAASKLVLELDPAHKGVQQMLADLYARKSIGSRPAASKPEAKAVTRAFELPPDEKGPPEKVVPVEAPLPEPVAAIEIELEPEGAVGGIEVELGTSERIVTGEIEVPIAGAFEPAPAVVAAGTLEALADASVEAGTAEVSPSVAAGAEPEVVAGTFEPVASVTPAIEAVAEPEVVAGTFEPVAGVTPATEAVAEPEVIAGTFEPVAGVTPAVAAVAEPMAVPAAAVSAAVEDVRVSVRVDGPSVSPPGLRPRAEKAAPPKADRPKTDLERSLEAFSMFDVDAKPVPSKVAVKAAVATSFTELELDESPDTLLHAIEAASVPVSSPSVLLSAEEVDAADERKPEPGALPKIPLFSDLPEDAFIALFEQCPLRRFEPGDRILRQGSVGDSFFVICAGSVKVVREDEGLSREVAALEEGSFFGEMALLSDSPRTASVDAASEDTQLLEISGAVLKKLSAQHPAVSAALKKFCRQRLLANLMNSAPLFRPFSKGDRRELVQKFRARDVGPGETLIHEGQATDGLYVVLAGEVAVLAQGKRVAAIKEGEVFGEMSLLTRGPATATVMSTKRTSLLRLPRDDFDRLIMSHPQILEMVAELTDARRRQNEVSLTSNGTAEMV